MVGLVEERKDRDGYGNEDATEGSKDYDACESCESPQEFGTPDVRGWNESFSC